MKNKLLILQILGWTLAFIFFYVYLDSRLKHPLYSFACAVTSFASYVLVIYGYSNFLYPRLYRRVSLIKFILIVVIFFAVVLGIRLLVEVLFVAPINHPGSSMFNFGPSHLLYGFVTSFLALITGILLTSVSDNILRTKREAELKRKHAESELNLLKAQLQPHFLFNSLNNLYYDVYKTQPEVAQRIAMLSDIMRYFLEHSPEEKVLLAVELDFINNYIELEQVRLPQPLEIEFEVQVSEGIMLPPMLLMPLVENLFKHGTSLRGPVDLIKLSLCEQKNQLIFTVINPLGYTVTGGIRTGVGIRNLRERLKLLYDQDFTLRNETTEETYTAQLIIPLL
ncbi:sensor histidine kinase [Aquiflexum sp.]|uniref:sensor histidine kinase n=1 Tax=Aquiflexum sp. TaxID=1872584 RepID=UPI003593F841